MDSYKLLPVAILDVGCKKDKMRKSERPKLQKRPYSPSELNRTSATKKSKISNHLSKTEHHKSQEFDLDKNGEKFECSSCGSNFITNPKKRKKNGSCKPSPRYLKVDQVVVALCNACGLREKRRPKRRHGSNCSSHDWMEAERKNYQRECEDFTSVLCRELGDKDAERLYCPYFSNRQCGCVQNYIIGQDQSVINKDQQSRARGLLELMKSSRQLASLRHWDKEEGGEMSQNASSKSIKRGIGNGQKKSSAFLDYILEQRTYLRNKLNFCEKGCQKILDYSNNLLYRKLKTEDNQSRIPVTNGDRDKLCAVTDLVRKTCCTNRCTAIARKYPGVVEEWRYRASVNKSECRRVIAEMATPYAESFQNCNRFIRLVTGSSLVTIGKVRRQILATGGERQPPEHGLKKYWELKQSQQNVLAHSEEQQTETLTRSESETIKNPNLKIDEGKTQESHNSSTTNTCNRGENGDGETSLADTGTRTDETWSVLPNLLVKRTLLIQEQKALEQKQGKLKDKQDSVEKDLIKLLQHQGAARKRTRKRSGQSAIGTGSSVSYANFHTNGQGQLRTDTGRESLHQGVSSRLESSLCSDAARDCESKQTSTDYLPACGDSRQRRSTIEHLPTNVVLSMPKETMKVSKNNTMESTNCPTTECWASDGQNLSNLLAKDTLAGSLSSILQHSGEQNNVLNSGKASYVSINVPSSSLTENDVVVRKINKSENSLQNKPLYKEYSRNTKTNPMGLLRNQTLINQFGPHQNSSCIDERIEIQSSGHVNTNAQMNTTEVCEQEMPLTIGMLPKITSDIQHTGIVSTTSVSDNTLTSGSMFSKDNMGLAENISKPLTYLSVKHNRSGLKYIEIPCNTDLCNTSLPTQRLSLKGSSHLSGENANVSLFVKSSGVQNIKLTTSNTGLNSENLLRDRVHSNINQGMASTISRYESQNNSVNGPTIGPSDQTTYVNSMHLPRNSHLSLTRSTHSLVTSGDCYTTESSLISGNTTSSSFTKDNSVIRDVNASDQCLHNKLCDTEESSNIGLLSKSGTFSQFRPLLETANSAGGSLPSNTSAENNLEGNKNSNIFNFTENRNVLDGRIQETMMQNKQIFLKTDLTKRTAEQSMNVKSSQPSDPSVNRTDQSLSDLKSKPFFSEHFQTMQNPKCNPTTEICAIGEVEQTIAEAGNIPGIGDQSSVEQSKDSFNTPRIVGQNTVPCMPYYYAYTDLSMDQTQNPVFSNVQVVPISKRAETHNVPYMQPVAVLGSVNSLPNSGNSSQLIMLQIEKVDDST